MGPGAQEGDGATSPEGATEPKKTFFAPVLPLTLLDVDLLFWLCMCMCVCVCTSHALSVLRFIYRMTAPLVVCTVAVPAKAAPWGMLTFNRNVSDTTKISTFTKGVCSYFGWRPAVRPCCDAFSRYTASSLRAYCVRSSVSAGVGLRGALHACQRVRALAHAVAVPCDPVALFLACSSLMQSRICAV